MNSFDDDENEITIDNHIVKIQELKKDLIKEIESL